MIIGYKILAASAAAAMLAGGAGVAQAQGSYGDLPPPPYAYGGGGYGGGYGGGCGHDRFTLLGVHAGVTVLGLDAGASAHLSVPTDGACEGGRPAFTPRPYAQPMGYGYQGYEQTYAPPPPRSPPPMAYGYPCGCQAPPRW